MHTIQPLVTSVEEKRSKGSFFKDSICRQYVRSLMNKAAFALVICCFGVTVTTAQDANPLKKVDGPSIYTDGIKSGNLFKFESHFESNPEAHKYFKRYNRTRRAELTTYAIAGGGLLVGLIGMTTCSRTSNEFCDVAPRLTAVAGAGILLVAFPIFTIARNGKRNKAIKTLNASYGSISPRPTNNLSIIGTSNGVGLAWTF